mmetsp:Transcript_31771/g.42090  ORF Transcript_31771/g.42090 Transcript_31771/m.42090 type:complete len:85 (+) Transcript_31771:54-308(+)
MPSEDWRVKKVFGCEKYNNIWVTATNTSTGKTCSLGAGANSQLVGHGQDTSVSMFYELELPDGVYMTKILCQGNSDAIVHAIDN